MLIYETCSNSSSLFKECNVSTIKQVADQLENKIKQQESHLKYLVAEKYRDLITISNEIVELNKSSISLDHNIAGVCFKETNYTLKGLYRPIEQVKKKSKAVRTRNLHLKNLLYQLDYMLLASDRAENVLEICEKYYVTMNAYGTELDSCKVLNVHLEVIFASLHSLLLNRIVKENNTIKELEVALVSVVFLNRFTNYSSLMQWFFHHRLSHLRTISDITHKFLYVHLTIQACSMVQDQTLNYKLFSIFANIKERHGLSADAKFSFNTDMSDVNTLYDNWLQDVSEDILKSYTNQSSKLDIHDLFSFFEKILFQFQESLLVNPRLLAGPNSLLVNISELFFDNYLKLVTQNINHVELSLSESPKKLFDPFTDTIVESLVKLPTMELLRNQLVANFLQLINISEKEINPLMDLKAFVQRSKEFEHCKFDTLLFSHISRCQSTLSKLLEKVQCSLFESLNNLSSDQPIDNICTVVSLSSLPGVNILSVSTKSYSSLVNKWLWTYLLHQLETLRPKLMDLPEGDLDCFVDIFFEYCCLLLPNVMFHEVYQHSCFAVLREHIVIEIARILSSKGCYYLEKHFLSHFLLEGSPTRVELRQNCGMNDAKLSNRAYKQTMFLFAPLLLIPDP